MEKEELMKRLSTAVKEGNIEEGEQLAKNGVESGYDVLEMFNVVTEALKKVGDRFGRGDMFLTELMFCGETARAAMAVLTEEIKRQKKEISYQGRVLMGTVAGDIHDIGKSMVAAMLTAEGFEVIDLGTDVPDETFVEKVRELKPDVLGLSALVDVTMFKFKDIVEALKKANLREKVKVIIGGAYVDQKWKDDSGSDEYAIDAVDGIEKIKAIFT